MTAKDVTIAREIRTAIDDAGLTGPPTVTYVNDDLIELDRVSGTEVYVSATLTKRRIARARWASTVLVDVTAVAPRTEDGAIGEADSEAEQDSWLAFIDEEVMPVIEDGTFDGRKPLEIAFLQRLSREKTRENALFYTKFRVTFPLV